MTSERDGCFVYITLPGETKPVVAGRFEVVRERQEEPLGRFIYGRSYLARSDAVEIDPGELSLGPGLRESASKAGLFGALRDAAPDYWGRRVIERHAGVVRMRELDYLLHSPDDRAGALGFGLGPEPPAPLRAFNRTLDLARLQRLADCILDEEALPGDQKDHAELYQAEELLLVGTSMGGARPKAVVEDEQGLWLAKFNRADDRWNHARAEHAMLLLARSCGLNAAESRVTSVGGRDVLLVKRFDRARVLSGYTRSRMLSALTLLRADESAQSRERWSYPFLVEELRRLSSEPKRDAVELFRRICFNALISNSDDHPRNHAVIAQAREWRLSPAYDLNPSAPVSVERRDLAMECGVAGRYANAENLVSEAPRFLLAKEEARAVIDAMEKQIQVTWYGVARASGMSEADCKKLAGAFAYPGFRLPLPYP